MSDLGFALDEYAVPKFGMTESSLGGTMPKADKEFGGLFGGVARHAEAVPSPDYYFKDTMAISFTQKMKGGKFSQLGRMGQNVINKGGGPGQYQVDNVVTSPRVKGGLMSKTDRKCGIIDGALKKTAGMPDPGKYDAVRPELHKACPDFGKSAGKTEPRQPIKRANIGPGEYNPSHALTEKSSPIYSGSKDLDGANFLDKVLKKKDAVPPPGHVGIPHSKHRDERGGRLHSARLLKDRDVSYRYKRSPPEESSKGFHAAAGGA